ncbi:MAG: hypothetical protein JSW39_03840 [Desulfobacterales bacterium]|nr:MAG: hypothetical protein JSW39_03840 [Desulfobacterales bacterium]
MSFARIKPAVSKYWLIAIAGLMWSIMGAMLCGLAYNWLAAVPWGRAVPLGSIGVCLALTAYHFGFSRIARKNIDRLRLFSERGCVFAFQAWKSYLIIGLMVMLGVILRHSAIPKHYLAIVYAAIGGALFLSSLHYYACLWSVMVLKQSRLPAGETIENKTDTIK